jgi:phosphate-selective porin OprO/OprP
MKWLRTGLAVLLAGSSPAWAQGASKAPPPDAVELERLQQRIEELEKKLEKIDDVERRVDGIWTRYDTDQQEQVKKDAEKAAATPKLSLNQDGLKFSTPDGAFESKIGLRLIHDFAWFDQGDDLEAAFGDEQDGTGFRAARLTLSGKVYSDITYQAEIDFAGENGGDTPRFRDVFLQYNGIPYFGDNAFDVRIGHFKEPFSLDELNAITDRAFQENPLIDTLVPSRNAGIQLSDSLIGEPKKERLSWQLGVFKETDDWPSSNDSDEDQGYQFTGRIAGLPYYANDGRQLIHVGAAYSLRNPDGAALPYGVRPETRLGLFRYINPDSALVPAGFRLASARADDVNLLGLELAAIFGGFSFQSEYVRSDVETTFGGDLTYDGWYAQAGYVITGENRVYRHDSGRIQRPNPERPFSFKGEKRGPGAWEVLARYGEVDLSSGPVQGGEHTSATLGLNWYLNKNFMVSWNYIHNEVDHPLFKDDFGTLQTRFQLEF